MTRMPIALIYQENLLSDALCACLEGGEFEVVWKSHGTSAMPADGRRPEIVLLEMPQVTSTLGEMIEAVRGETEAPSIAVLSIGGNEECLSRAREAGADAFLTTQMSLEAFRECLRLIAMGVQVFPATARRPLRPCEAEPSHNAWRADHAPLSEREVEIVTWLSVGLSNKMIARRLDITESTVKTHLKAILRKIGAANRTQAAIWAVSHGMHPPA